MKRKSPTKSQNKRDTKASRKALMARRERTAIARVGKRWDGAMAILDLCQRACPDLKTGVDGGYILQQKYGI